MSASTPIGRTDRGQLVLLLDPREHGEMFQVYVDVHGNRYTGDQVAPVHYHDNGDFSGVLACCSDAPVPYTLAGSSALSGAGGPAIPDEPTYYRCERCGDATFRGLCQACR